VGKFYTLVSRAKGAQKDTQKFLKINGKTLKLNEYDSQRDESVCVEVKL
jgi:hypothetical protein